MHYKARTLAKRPNAILTSRENGYGFKFYVVYDEAEALDDWGHANRGPKGAWRDAYHHVMRMERAEKAARAAIAEEEMP
jgi:hypothetical protein